MSRDSDFYFLRPQLYRYSSCFHVMKVGILEELYRFHGSGANFLLRATELLQPLRYVASWPSDCQIRIRLKVQAGEMEIQPGELRDFLFE